jgi:cell division protein FtsW (lipid II flippase)
MTCSSSSTSNGFKRYACAPRLIALIAVSLLSTVSFTAAVVVLDGLAAYVPFVGFLALVVLILYLSSCVNIAARWVPGYSGLDEFQRAQMDQATLRGHRLTQIMLTVLLAAASGIGGAMVTTELPGTLVIAILLPFLLLTALCHASFPAAFLAWTRPDEEDAEEDDDPDQA